MRKRLARLRSLLSLLTFFYCFQQQHCSSRRRVSISVHYIAAQPGVHPRPLVQERENMASAAGAENVLPAPIISPVRGRYEWNKVDGGGVLVSFENLPANVVLHWRFEWIRTGKIFMITVFVEVHHAVCRNSRAEEEDSISHDHNVCLTGRRGLHLILLIGVVQSSNCTARHDHQS